MKRKTDSKAGRPELPAGNTHNQTATGATHARKAFLAAPAMAICALLASAGSAKAQDDAACANRTIKGAYGFTIDGLVQPAPGTALPVRGIVMTNFDGKGNLTQVDHVVVNGAAPTQEWTEGMGTYHINGNCTGTMVIQVPSIGDVVTFRMIVVKQGKQIHAIVTAPFNGLPRTVAIVGTKVE